MQCGRLMIITTAYSHRHILIDLFRLFNVKVRFAVRDWLIAKWAIGRSLYPAHDWLIGWFIFGTNSEYFFFHLNLHKFDRDWLLNSKYTTAWRRFVAIEHPRIHTLCAWDFVDTHNNREMNATRIFFFYWFGIDVNSLFVWTALNEWTESYYYRITMTTIQQIEWK